MITLYDINQILKLFKLKYKKFDFDMSELWDWYEFTNGLKLSLFQKTAIRWINNYKYPPRLEDILYQYAEICLNRH